MIRQGGMGKTTYSLVWTTALSDEVEDDQLASGGLKKRISVGE